MLSYSIVLSFIHFYGCRKSDWLLICMSKFIHMIISILYVVKLQRIILDNMLFMSS